MAEKATKASGSGRQSTQAKAKENAGHRNRTSVPTGEIGMLGLRAVEGAGPYGKDWNGWKCGRHGTGDPSPTKEIGTLMLRAVEGAGPYGKDWNG